MCPFDIEAMRELYKTNKYFRELIVFLLQNHTKVWEAFSDGPLNFEDADRMKGLVVRCRPSVMQIMKSLDMIRGDPEKVAKVLAAMNELTPEERRLLLERMPQD